MKINHTMLCTDCGKEMTGSVENYRYTECGLQCVTLTGIVVYHCACGAISPEIPNMARLHRGIFANLLEKETQLSGEEIKFLRGMASLSATELGRIMGVTKQAVSRWENDGQMGIEKDKFLRTVCFLRLLREDLATIAGPEVAEAVDQIDLSKFDITEMLKDVKKAAKSQRKSKKLLLDPKRLVEYGGGILGPARHGEPVPAVN